MNIIFSGIVINYDNVYAIESLPAAIDFHTKKGTVRWNAQGFTVKEMNRMAINMHMYLVAAIRNNKENIHLS